MGSGWLSIGIGMRSLKVNNGEIDLTSPQQDALLPDMPAEHIGQPCTPPFTSYPLDLNARP